MTLTTLMMLAILEAVGYFLLGFLLIAFIINLCEDFFNQ
jgi:hypothetical protein